MGENSIRRGLAFDKKDEPLRRDVHYLGEVIGKLLREQGGRKLYDRVESARRLAIERRESGSDVEAKLLELLSGLDAVDAREVIRAYSVYFELVNIAEKVHRIRRRREYLRDADEAQPLGLEAALVNLKEQGLTRDEVLTLLNASEIVPVFTAHPTEPTRRTILRKEQNIVRLLVALLDTGITPPERKAFLANIRSEITTIWQTEENPAEGMSVADELEHVLFFMTDVLYRCMPPLYENIESGLAKVFGDTVQPPAIDTLVRFGSWVGGDMDGNPNVTAKTIRSTLARQRSLILNLYYEECAEIASRLSQTANRVTVSNALLAQTELYRGHFPDAMAAVPARHRNMPYRVFLRLVQARLQSTFDDSAFPYDKVADFEADLVLVQTSLSTGQGEHAGLFSVTRLLRRIRTFGFHLLSLDIRLDARDLRSVVGAGLADGTWMEASTDYRADKICEALSSREPPANPGETRTRKMLAVFQAIAFCKRKYGPRSIGLFVISMCHGPDDVLSVLLLAQWGELANRRGVVRLDIAPLLETVADLDNGSDIMRSLLANPTYANHLAARERAQTIMIGYSDSNKDGGFASARWALQSAQTRLVADLADEDIELTLFHGRGGTISRGGSRSHSAILGAPARTINGRLRVTEQGEIINEKYGVRGIALRNLEQMIGSVALVSASDRQPEDVPAAWQAFMQTLANESRSAYRRLIYNTEGFYGYFREATPIDAIEQMQIGSRPASRRDMRGIEDLRAIPWVFSWTQSRFGLTGWYGFGTGLHAALAEHDMNTLREMIREWPFAAIMLQDAETVLAKADLSIAQRYSQLAGDKHEQFFPGIQSEFDLTRNLVLDILQHEKLLEADPILQRSIRLRNPYLDPVSLLQVELLKRWRDGDREDDQLRDALFASINGIAQGLQNTG